ncbi:LLM class flavin-dependent oxidoreductase [Pseudonocardia asaccharolytica]|uniref:Luciferase n=1 Tax=Pseudonocardia asaccharolytica DSM 44247 = NBRC 16224 TaxID=1123024 RepID=A0A511D2T9_9PSEU|nr:LLM class flavin-dependent oxidoreductase [Pseudonocardia asaccharolytica]GEL17218.1 luciferase [Pseudonocardia asaccharolytica DSM 44247 = NBRC 16224]
MGLHWGLLQEGETPLGTSHYHRYKQLVKEVQFAEEMGFDFWGGSEQHGLSPIATTSAPDILYAYIAAQTSRINFMHQIVLLPHKINHPLRVAERIATLDIVSDGRAILGVGRGNNPFQLAAFGADATTVRAEMMESLEVIGKALSHEEFEHVGERLNIPRMSLSPRPYQNPHPPIMMVGTSLESNRYAGEMGIGIINFDNWLGWDELEEKAAAYKTAIKNPTRQVGGAVFDRMCNCVITAYCAETREEAKAIAGPIAMSFLGAISELTYGRLAKESPDYAYMARTGEELQEIIKNNDLDALIERTPSILIGTPDDFIERGRRLEAMGYDEVTLRLEGMGHEQVLRSMELIGRHVIPHFKAPNSIARVAPVGDGRIT